MKSLKWTGLLAVVMTMGMAAPAFSHHSHAMFDHAKQISVTGTVTEYVYRNPHVFLYIDVKGENGSGIEDRASAPSPRSRQNARSPPKCDQPRCSS